MATYVTVRLMFCLLLLRQYYKAIQSPERQNRETYLATVYKSNDGTNKRNEFIRERYNERLMCSRTLDLANT